MIIIATMRTVFEDEPVSPVVDVLSVVGVIVWAEIGVSLSTPSPPATASSPSSVELIIV